MSIGYATMSIDWEDFGQLAGKNFSGNVTPPVNGNIERQTKIILDLLDETDNKATFFVLGMLAQYRSRLLKEIKTRGHEIALHGQNHEAMFLLSPAKANDDITTSKKIITDITGDQLSGYRAPFFSVKKENLWLLDTLAELGFLYDSSIFPMALPRYGIARFPINDAWYRLPGGQDIVELPMTTAKFMNRQWPVCGGGYIRILPGFMINRIFKNFARQKKDSMLYMHPYEFDSEKLNASTNYPAGTKYSAFELAALNFRWNVLRAGIHNKMKSLLKQHHFITCLEKAQQVRTSTSPAPLPEFS